MSDTKMYNLSKWLNKRFERLLRSRKHESKLLTLSHKTIYVLPSKFGLVYSLFSLMIFILGSNYQNNLVLITAYLMFSFLIINFFVSYNNLVGLQIKFISTKAGYAHSGYSITFQLKKNTGAEHLKFTSDIGNLFVPGLSENDGIVSIKQNENTRGKYPLKRLKIESNYPFGLVKCWSYVLFTEHVYVYPNPVPFSIHQISQENEDDGDENVSTVDQRGQNLHTIRPYIAGDSLSRISWKHFAKNFTLHTKEFDSPVSQDIHFNINSVPGDFELKLNHLSYLINQAENDGLRYSLSLPNKRLPVNSGVKHYTLCMEALSDA